MKDIVISIGLIAGVAVIIWIAFFGPCEIYFMSKISAVPARCIDHFLK